MSSKKTAELIQGVGVAKLENKIVLFYCQGKSEKIHIALLNEESKEFEKINQQLNLPKKTSELRISQNKKGKHYLTAVKTEEHLNQLIGGEVNKNFRIKKLNKINTINSLGMIVPHYKYKGERVLFSGGKGIKISYSKNLKKWQSDYQPIFQPQEEILGRSYLKIGRIFNQPQGILIICFRYQESGIKENYSYQLILFDKKNPQQEIWSKEIPIQGNFPTNKLKTAYPFGVIKFKNKLISYWNVNNQNIYSLEQAFFEFKKSFPSSPFPYQEKLKRHRSNPILEPIPENSWESKLVFNPAAVYEDNKTHLIYRAVGDDDVSVLGYASSDNGLEINYRHHKPAYVPSESFETNPQAPKTTFTYTSPWGAGGCEDPKLTKIENKIYMTYTAWNGSDPPGVALTSIKVKDFVNRNWNWQEPVKISPPGEIHKNWVIFPEKIKGKYAILHSLNPKVLVDYFDDLNFDGKTFIDSYYEPSGRKNHWDNWMRGAGPPPMKTKEGWLVLYHAMDYQDPGRYKLGVMVLDHDNPTKINYRSNYPLLEPNEKYENEGFKSGVVYSCGAVIKDNRLYVYYGGADTVGCVAHIKLEKLLNNLKKQKHTTLRQAKRIELTKQPVISYTLNN